MQKTIRNLYKKFLFNLTERKNYLHYLQNGFSSEKKNFNFNISFFFLERFEVVLQSGTKRLDDTQIFFSCLRGL